MQDCRIPFHQEWDFVQRITLYMRTEFQPVEEALQEVLLPSLFKGNTYQIPGGAVTSMPFKTAEIAL